MHASRFHPRRRGFTLIELVSAMISVSLLSAALMSATYLSVRGLNRINASMEMADVSERMRDMAAELRHAKSIVNWQGGELRFTLADQTGDNNDETIAYAWTGNAGDPITREMNGGGAHRFHHRGRIRRTRPQRGKHQRSDGRAMVRGHIEFLFGHRFDFDSYAQ